MGKDFTNVRFLRFSANDPWECIFQDVVIDLVTDRLIGGIIAAGSENEDTWSVDVKNGFDTLPNSDCSIFAKVVDTGVYELLDDDHNVLFKSEGYVPFLMDYYNRRPSYGDCIELLIDDIETGHLAHANKHKISFNHESDWLPIEQHPNLYEKGMNDAFLSVRNVLMNAKSPDTAISDIFTLISNFNNKTEN